jgi:hypothetical protein
MQRLQIWFVLILCPHRLRRVNPQLRYLQLHSEKVFDIVVLQSEVPLQQLLDGRLAQSRIPGVLQDEDGPAPQAEGLEEGREVEVQMGLGRDGEVGVGKGDEGLGEEPTAGEEFISNKLIRKQANLCLLSGNRPGFLEGVSLVITIEGVTKKKI